jgi:hypothetical protein
VNDIYLHNRDWEINEKRCPMYMTSILEVDLHWLGENWEVSHSDVEFYYSLMICFRLASYCATFCLEGKCLQRGL